MGVRMFCIVPQNRKTDDDFPTVRHNSHIGDARSTSMGWQRGELNIGQLVREKFGEFPATCLVGFGTHTGTVACASDWDEPMEIKRVLPSRPDSFERLFHDTGIARCLVDLTTGRSTTGSTKSKAAGQDTKEQSTAPENSDLIKVLTEPRLERFIGVIYRPDTERWSHYSAARLARQFDGYVYFDETRAIVPLKATTEPDDENPAVEETYPFGV